MTEIINHHEGQQAEGAQIPTREERLLVIIAQMAVEERLVHPSTEH